LLSEAEAPPTALKSFSMKYQNNHAAALRGQQQYNRKQVLYLTGLTDQQLTQMQMFLLSEWLSYFHPAHTPDEWMCSEGLWKWWLYVWNDLDEQVLPAMYNQGNQVNRLANYRLHVQQVFNANYNTTAKQLMADFKSLITDFEKELKRAIAPTISNIPQGHPSPLERGGGEGRREEGRL
jgi:hypothetical protein